MLCKILFLMAVLQITPHDQEKLPDLSGVINIPDHIIVDGIFEYLDLPDLLKLGLTNKKNHKLINNYFTSPRKGRSTIYSIRVTNKLLKSHFDKMVQFLAYNKNSIALNCSHTAVENRHLSALAAIPNLQKSLVSLNLCWCTAVTDDGLALVTQNFKNLKQLTISCCVQITDDGVNKGIKDLKSLQKLGLSYCRNLSYKTIKELQKKGLKLSLTGLKRGLRNNICPPKKPNRRLLKKSSVKKKKSL